MKNFKRLVTLGAVTLAIGATSLTAFAASQYSTPAEALAGITGRTVESLVEERKESNKTYGTIAQEEGKLDEFKLEVLEMKKANLAAQVDQGKITQDKADDIIEKLEENQANCDGTGRAQVGRKLGAKFGSNGEGLGNGGENRGNGQARGQGSGRGMGMGGMRLQDGSCLVDDNK